MGEGWAHVSLGVLVSLPGPWSGLVTTHWVASPTPTSALPRVCVFCVCPQLCSILRHSTASCKDSGLWHRL